MVEKALTIKNELGIHARPAAQFAKLASSFKSSVYIVKNGLEVNGKSLMMILTLEAGFGSKITLKIEGEDEEAAANALEDLVVRQKFNEN